MTERNFKILEKLALNELAIWQDNLGRAKLERIRRPHDDSLVGLVVNYENNVALLEDALSELRAMRRY